MESMGEAAKPTSRRFRYSLRTLFVLLTLFAVLVGWLTWNLRQVNEREKLLRAVAARGAMFGSVNSSRPPRPLPIVWSLLGATAIGLIEVPDGICSEREFRQLTTLFPEAKVVTGSVKFDPLNVDF
jgi:hypothetical protein